MVLVGQTYEVEQDSEKVIVATTNVRHIELFMDARRWNEIAMSDLD